MRSTFPAFLLLLLTLGPTASSAAQNRATPPAQSATASPSELPPAGARFLGEREENEVLAKAWVAANGTSGIVSRASERLLVIRFLTSGSRIPIEKGLVAFKIEDGEGRLTPARKLEYRDGYFVTGFDLPPGGPYQLHIGSRLEDDRKRQFRFDLPVR